jgi:hypothetical protein
VELQARLRRELQLRSMIFSPFPYEKARFLGGTDPANHDHLILPRNAVTSLKTVREDYEKRNYLCRCGYNNYLLVCG